MDFKTVERLKPLMSLESHKDYARIRKRQNSGLMTTYVWNGKIFFDPDENIEKFNCGPKLKCIEFEKKPIIVVEKFIERNVKI